MYLLDFLIVIITDIYAFWYLCKIHPNGHPFKLGLTCNLVCGRHKQAIEMASHILCDGEELATLFRHLGQHFMKPSNSEDI